MFFIRSKLEIEIEEHVSRIILSRMFFARKINHHENVKRGIPL